MHALGVPTSRSLTLYVSHAETVRRPWYSENSRSMDPDVMVDNPAAISTRVAPSFLRVGQLELFARRARSEAHPRAHQELHQIVVHLIERNYRQEIDPRLPFSDQVVLLARLFRDRLTTTQVLPIGVQQLNGLIGGEVTPHRRHTHQQQRRTTVQQRSTGSRIQLQFTFRPKHVGQPTTSIAQGFGVGMEHRPPPFALQQSLET